MRPPVRSEVHGLVFSGGLEWSPPLNWFWVAVGTWSLRLGEERGWQPHGPLYPSEGNWVWRVER